MSGVWRSTNRRVGPVVHQISKRGGRFANMADALGWLIEQPGAVQLAAIPGTATATAGTNKLNGVGTDWQTSVRPNDIIMAASGFIPYIVKQVISNTEVKTWNDTSALVAAAIAGSMTALRPVKYVLEILDGDLDMSGLSNIQLPEGMDLTIRSRVDSILYNAGATIKLPQAGFFKLEGITCVNWTQGILPKLSPFNGDIPVHIIKDCVFQTDGLAKQPLKLVGSTLIMDNIFLYESIFDSIAMDQLVANNVHHENQNPASTLSSVWKLRHPESYSRENYLSNVSIDDVSATVHDITGGSSPGQASNAKTWNFRGCSFKAPSGFLLGKGIINFQNSAATSLDFNGTSGATLNLINSTQPGGPVIAVANAASSTVNRYAAS